MLCLVGCQGVVQLWNGIGGVDGFPGDFQLQSGPASLFWGPGTKITRQVYNMFVVYFDQQMHACACVRIVENDQKHWKMKKKVPFPSCVLEAHVRLMKKTKKKVCWSAIESDSQKLVDT